MQDKKYQIFISSTYKDLIKARQRVSEAILNLYHLPVGMEMFSADDDEQWEVIKEIIDLSDYYILIVGHRYGSLTREGISYTEKEYNYAIEKGIPVLAFIRHRDVPVSETDREQDETSRIELNRFLDKIQNKLCNYWQDDDELTLQVTLALSKIFTRKPRIGWVRGDQALLPEVASEIARLSQENHELKKQLAELTSKPNKPKLKFETNIQELHILDDAFDKMIAPNLLDRTHIPEYLQAFITDEEISSYNYELTQQINSGKINQYIDEYQNYWSATHYSKSFTFNICNIGNTKANDVYISINFPNEIKVLFKDKLPKQPESIFPKNPISIAKQKYEAQSTNSNLQELVARAMISHITNDSVSDLLQTNERTIRRSQQGLRISDNILHIGNDTDILHTRCIYFDESDEIIIYPLKEGTFNIRVELICAEYTEKEIIEIPITVTKLDE